MASFPFAMIDLYSYPTSRLTVNVAIIGTIVVFTYVAFSLLLKALWSFVKQEWTFRGIGADPVANFVHGHAPYVMDSGKGLKWFASCTHRHPKMHCTRLGTFKFLVVHHPETVKVILSSEPKLEFIYVPLYPWLGESVLTGSGPKWLRTRRLLTPSFHFDILKPYVGVFSKCTDVVVEKWSKIPVGQSVEIFHDISLLTLDVMLRCTCSFESNCQVVGTHNEYIKSIYDLSRLLYERLLYFYYYWDTVYFLSKDGREFKKAANTVHNFSMNVITKRRKELEEKKLSSEPSCGKRRRYLDFIDTLLEAKDVEGVGMTDSEIRAEVDTFMFEGHDTTASGISWMLYNLARHPEHQAKCHEEVDTFFDSLEDDDITWDDLTKDGSLQYLTMCLKESMRLYPPVPVIGRCLTKETEFGGRKMAPDTMVICLIYALHHHPGVWDNPEEYDPHRFSKENEGKIPPFAYVPFSAGSRNCIGKQFAFNEEKCVLAKILHHFELSLDEERPPEVMATMITRAKNGLYLKVKKRNN